MLNKYLLIKNKKGKKDRRKEGRKEGEERQRQRGRERRNKLPQKKLNHSISFDYKEKNIYIIIKI